jgi:putative transposase
LSESPCIQGDGREKEQVYRSTDNRCVARAGAGGTTGEVCRRHGISPQTFYRWKAKYGGLEVSDAQKLKVLEDENRRLKKLLAESMLDVAALKDLLGNDGPSIQWTPLLSL